MTMAEATTLSFMSAMQKPTDGDLVHALYSLWNKTTKIRGRSVRVTLPLDLT